MVVAIVLRSLGTKGLGRSGQIRRKQVPPRRFERPTNGLGNRCSIQLSYGGKAFQSRQLQPRSVNAQSTTMNRLDGAPVSRSLPWRKPSSSRNDHPISSPPRSPDQTAPLPPPSLRWPGRHLPPGPWPLGERVLVGLERIGAVFQRYSCRRVFHGSFPGFRAGIKPAPSSIATGAPRMNPRASIPRM